MIEYAGLNFRKELSALTACADMLVVSNTGLHCPGRRAIPRARKEGFIGKHDSRKVTGLLE